MSPCSRNQAVQPITLRIVSVKPSQTQQVQLAAVRPPRRISSNTERPKSEMISPSMTIDVSCKFEAMWFPFSHLRGADGCVHKLSHIFNAPIVRPVPIKPIGRSRHGTGIKASQGGDLLPSGGMAHSSKSKRACVLARHFTDRLALGLRSILEISDGDDNQADFRRTCRSEPVAARFWRL